MSSAHYQTILSFVSPSIILLPYSILMMNATPTLENTGTGVCINTAEQECHNREQEEQRLASAPDWHRQPRIAPSTLPATPSDVQAGGKGTPGLGFMNVEDITVRNISGVRSFCCCLFSNLALNPPTSSS